MTRKKKILLWIAIPLAIVALAVVLALLCRIPSRENALIYISPSTQSTNLYADGVTTEQENMYAVAEKVVAYLNAAGCHAVMSEEDCTLEEAVESSNRQRADLHVAIHSNAVGDGVSVVRGCEIYALSGDRRAYNLASDVYDRMEALTPTKDRGVKETTTLYELNTAKATSILIETDFHDNAEGAAWLTTHRAEIAQAIADGILDYLN